MASVRISPPGSSAVVTIADDRVGQYEARGWTVVSDTPTEEPKKHYQTKAELLELASERGIDADDSLTRKEILDLLGDSE